MLGKSLLKQAAARFTEAWKPQGDAVSWIARQCDFRSVYLMSLVKLGGMAGRSILTEVAMPLNRRTRHLGGGRGISCGGHNLCHLTLLLVQRPRFHLALLAAEMHHLAPAARLYSCRLA